LPGTALSPAGRSFAAGSNYWEDRGESLPPVKPGDRKFMSLCRAGYPHRVLQKVSGVGGKPVKSQENTKLPRDGSAF